MARADATELLLDTLKSGGPSSRADLARATGLAESTVSVTIGDLVAEGLVVEAEALQAPGRAGRPPVVVRLGRSAGLVLGIDLGKSHARLALSDLGHVVLAERTVEVIEDRPAPDQIADVAVLTNALIAEVGAHRSELVAAALGLPGPVHQVTGRLGDGTILPGWVGVQAAEAMEAALGLPVAVDNDANLGALGEWTWGAARGSKTAVYVKISTGVGAGLIVAGQPFGGAGGTAGEIGHTVVDPSGPLCRCGKRGCLEMLAGSQAVLRRVASTHGGEAGLREVIEAARGGDKLATLAIAESGRAVGTALATLCNLINPERVVIGGTMAAAGELLRAALESGTLPSAWQDVGVVEGELRESAEAHGALALALRYAVPRRA